MTYVRETATVIVLALALRTCAEERRAYATRVSGADLVAALARYDSVNSTLPESLLILCGGRQRDCAYVGGIELTDGWKNPFHYQRYGNAYSLRSGGPDGRIGTVDDVDFSSEAREGRMRAIAGCWRLHSTLAEHPIHRIELDSTLLPSGEYLARDSAGSPIAQWAPWNGDSLKMTIYGTRIVEVSARVIGRDSIVGETIAFPGHLQRPVRKALKAERCF